MIQLALSVPGRFYREAITKALERTGNFRVRPLEDYETEAESLAREGPPGAARGDPAGILSGMKGARDGPDVALLGVSVQQNYTLMERRDVIRDIRERAPNCRIVLFLDELVSPEQTEGVKSLKQARLIDGFLYASGTMEYLVATLESI